MKDNSWIQNVENIFTKEELDALVKQGKLILVKRDKQFHYIKTGCKKDFLNQKAKVIKMYNWDWIGNNKYKKFTQVMSYIKFIHEIYENLNKTIVTLDYKLFEEFDIEIN